MSLHSLPPEVMVQLFSFINNDSLTKMALVSRSFYGFAHTALLTTVEFGEVWPAHPLPEDCAEYDLGTIKAFQDTLNLHPNWTGEIRNLYLGPIDGDKYPQLYRAACDLLMQCLWVQSLELHMTYTNHHPWHHNWALWSLKYLVLGDYTVGKRELIHYLSLPKLEKICVGFIIEDEEDPKDSEFRKSSVSILGISEHSVFLFHVVEFIFRCATAVANNLTKIEIPLLGEQVKASALDSNADLGSDGEFWRWELSFPMISNWLQRIGSSLQSLRLIDNTLWEGHDGSRLCLRNFRFLEEVEVPLLCLFGDESIAGSGITDLLPRVLKKLKITIKWELVKELENIWAEHPFIFLPRRLDWLDELGRAPQTTLPSLQYLEIEEQEMRKCKVPQYFEAPSLPRTDAYNEFYHGAGIEFHHRVLKAEEYGRA